MIQEFDPTRVLVDSRGGALSNLKVQSASVAASVGTGTSIIAAVSGQRHRILGWHLSAGLAGNTVISLRDGAGGTVLAQFNLVATARDFAPISFSGYFECSTNTALVCDLTTTDGLVNIFYVTYTPPA